MAISDFVQNLSNKVLPEKRGSLPLQPSSTGMGIGNGGHVPFDDDDADGLLVFLLFIPLLWIIWIWMIVSKPAIIFFTSQVFFNFLAMCCWAGVASFQAKWKVGPSGLTGFTIFVTVIGIFYSLFLLLVPVIYEKYDKGARLARALKEIRVSFILAGAGTAVTLLMAFITTISAWTEPGCKNAQNDPHAKEKGKDFINGLPSWCSTKKAGAVFLWFVFAFWVGTLTLTVLDFRNGKNTRPRDPPFTHPTEEPTEMDEEESMYEHNMSVKPTYENSNSSQSPFSDANRFSGVPTVGPSVNSSSYVTAPSQPRQSMDVYGAFSDPAPRGFAEPEPESPRVSRTLQYADPYAAVRTAVSQGGAPEAPASPPGYPSYAGGYR